MAPKQKMTIWLWNEEVAALQELANAQHRTSEEQASRLIQLALLQADYLDDTGKHTPRTEYYVPDA